MWILAVPVIVGIFVLAWIGLSFLWVMWDKFLK